MGESRLVGVVAKEEKKCEGEAELCGLGDREALSSSLKRSSCSERGGIGEASKVRLQSVAG